MGECERQARTWAHLEGSVRSDPLSPQGRPPDALRLVPNGRGAGGRSSAARVDVLRAALGVVGRGRKVGGGSLAGGLPPGLEQPLEEGPAPTASRAGAKTIGKLADALGMLQANKVFDFPPGNVKAEAKLVVGVHGLGSE